MLTQTVEACRRYIDPKDKEFINTSAGRAEMIGDGIWGGTIIPKLDKLILGAIATQEAAFADKLCDAIRTLTTNWEESRAYVLSKTEGHDMFQSRERPLMAAQAGLLPLAFDAVYERLTPADREAARAFLREQVAEPFKGYLLGGKTLRQLALGINIAWWDFNSALWSLAAVYDANTPGDDEALAMAGDVVRRGIHMGVDSAGVVGEGPFYGTIDLSAWLSTAEVLSRAGVCNLWEEEPLIARAMRTKLYYTTPDWRGALVHCDGQRYEAAHFQGQPLLLAAARLREPAIQTLWERIANNRLPQPTVHHPYGVLAPALWYDTNPAPLAMGEGNWPLALGGGRWGLHFFRSGWGGKDLAFNLHGAGRDPGTFIHQMVDAGHFSLAALGEIFCAGRGYAHTNSEFQNVIAPDGKEPADAPGGVGQMWRGGVTRTFAPGRRADYACVDTAWQWGAVWSYRHALVVRASGTDPFVVLYDNCNHRNDWGTWDWRFQIEDDHTATLDPANLRAAVQGKVNRLELAWAHYREEDFPKPHRLEVMTDRSGPCDVKHHDRTGGKGFPRLVARLHGYNAGLLSALVPRRKGASPVGITRIADRYQFGLVIDHGQFTDTVVAAPFDRRITIGGIDGEAAMAIVRRDREGKAVFAAAGESFRLAVDGAALQRGHGEALPFFEWAR